MFYKIISLGKGSTGWGAYHLGKHFASVEEAVRYVNTAKSRVDENRYYAIFIENSNGETVAVRNCLGWQYK